MRAAGSAGQGKLRTIAVRRNRDLPREADLALHEKTYALAERGWRTLREGVALDDSVDLCVHLDEAANVVADIVDRAVKRIRPDEHLAVTGNLISFGGHEAQHFALSA